MADEHQQAHRYRDPPADQAEIADLGDGVYLTIDLDRSGPDPDPCLVAACLLRRIGRPVSVLRLANLDPGELEELWQWAAGELVWRAVAAGRLARRAPPGWLERLAH